MIRRSTDRTDYNRWLGLEESLLIGDQTMKGFASKLENSVSGRSQTAGRVGEKSQSGLWLTDFSQRGGIRSDLRFLILRKRKRAPVPMIISVATITRNGKGLAAIRVCPAMTIPNA